VNIQWRSRNSRFALRPTWIPFNHADLTNYSPGSGRAVYQWAIRIVGLENLGIREALLDPKEILLVGPHPLPSVTRYNYRCPAVLSDLGRLLQSFSTSLYGFSPRQRMWNVNQSYWLARIIGRSHCESPRRYSLRYFTSLKVKEKSLNIQENARNTNLFNCRNVRERECGTKAWPVYALDTRMLEAYPIHWNFRWQLIKHWSTDLNRVYILVCNQTKSHSWKLT